MTDRDTLTVSLHHVPDADHAAVLAVLANRDFNYDWGPLPETLVIDGVYVRPDTKATPEEVAADIKAASPRAAFEVHSDPRYEWLGTIIKVVPGMDDFTGDCDADGNVRPLAIDIADWLSNGIPADLNDRLGITHDNALNAAFNQDGPR